MSDRTTVTLSAIVFALVLLVQRRMLTVYRRRVGEFRTMDDNQLSLALLKPLKVMTNIALPTVFCREGFFTMVFIVLFGIQAVLRVLKTQADGKVVQALLAGKGLGLRSAVGRTLGTFVGYSLMEAIVAGCIEHLRLFLISQYRAKLTRYFHKRFFSGLTFYHSAVLDDRVQNADTQITIYCHEFAEHFAELPYYFLLPLFEALTALFFVVRNVGAKSASLMSVVVLGSLIVLKKLQPPFGKMHEAGVTREEEFRKLHNDAKMNVEQLGLHHAGDYTRRRLDASFLNVQTTMEQFALARGHFTMLETSISGAIWDVATLLLCGRTVINMKEKLMASKAAGGGAGRRGGMAKDDILSTVIVQRRLITSFHGAVKTFVVNSKELSHLTEFTEKLAEFENTLNSIQRGKLVKKPDPRFIDSTGSFMMPTKEQVLQITNVVQSPAMMDVQLTEDWDEESVAESLRESMLPIVVFDHVSVRTPNGVPLVKDLSFEIKMGESWVVTGPNGSGKSSILRVLAGMWLPRRGKVVIHPAVELFFLPQMPYFVADATLMDQLFFPQPAEYGTGGILGRVGKVISAKYRSLALEAMKSACASGIVTEVLGGWDSGIVGSDAEKRDTSFDWSSLSGGQQQKLALARLFFNVAMARERGRIPLAVMDESTSQMDHDSEAILFRNLRNKDIGCISVSHRESVTQHHTKVLTLTQSDNWKIRSQRPVAIEETVVKK